MGNGKPAARGRWEHGKHGPHGKHERSRGQCAAGMLLLAASQRSHLRGERPTRRPSCDSNLTAPAPSPLTLPRSSRGDPSWPATRATPTLHDFSLCSPRPGGLRRALRRRLGGAGADSPPPLPLAPSAGGPSAAPAPPQTPIVRAIEIQYAGPATVSKEKILANMRTRVGRPYSQQAVEDDIRSLYATNLVSNVRIFGEPMGDGVKVVVVVAGKSTLERGGAERRDAFHAEPRAQADHQQAGRCAERGDAGGGPPEDPRLLHEPRLHRYRRPFRSCRPTSTTGKTRVVFTVTEGSRTIVRRGEVRGEYRLQSQGPGEGRQDQAEEHLQSLHQEPASFPPISSARM